MAYRGLGCLLVLLLACSSSDDGPIAAEVVGDEDVLEEIAEQEVSTVVWVRAHMNPQGYGGVAFKGSVQDDFAAVALGADFAAALATRDPLPEDCDF
jgi:hypothetical protein